MAIKLNTEFQAVQTGQEFKLVKIIETQKGKKIPDPIYEFEYTNRPGANFTKYLKDINKLMLAGSWVRL